MFVAYYLFHHLMSSIFFPNDVNSLKRERAVVFIKYGASVISLIFPNFFLFWNKMVLPASNSLNFPGLVENELKGNWPANLWKSLKEDIAFKI